MCLPCVCREARCVMVDGFIGCPLLDVDAYASSALFWEEFGANPRPVRIRIAGDDDEFDFFTAYGAAQTDGSHLFGGELHVGGRSRSGGYVLTNIGYTPKLFRDLRLADRFRIPAVAASIDQRPVLSIGLNGTGERDLAHHYHPATVMRLVQGRKIWALRAPGDEECMWAQGTCTDPFLVCDYYSSPLSREPACVQRAGETILVPDGWYHGTCNTETTVGYGVQGRSLWLLPPACFHCNARDARGQMAYATTANDTPLLSVSDARELRNAIADGAARQLRPAAAEGEASVGFPFLHLGPVAAQALYMARTLHSLPSTAERARRAERMHAGAVYGDPIALLAVCSAHAPGGGGERRAALARLPAARAVAQRRPRRGDDGVAALEGARGAARQCAGPARTSPAAPSRFRRDRDAHARAAPCGPVARQRLRWADARCGRRERHGRRAHLPHRVCAEGDGGWTSAGPAQ